MSDDLDDLKRAFDAGLPGPDPDTRAEAIALAMKNFDRAQENDALARQTSEPTREGGFFRGARQMFANISNRGFLTATTAIAAVAMVALIPVLRDSQPPEVGVVPLGHTVAKPDSEVLEPATAVEEVAPAPEVALPGVKLSGAAERGILKGSDGAEFHSDLDIEFKDTVNEAPVPPSPAPALTPAPRMQTRGPDPASGGLLSLESNVTNMKRSAPIVRPMPAPLPDPTVAPDPNTEAFPEAEDNPIKVTAESPVSTFSIDVDTASWAFIRNALNRGQLPPKDAVRIEEMVNYFSYDYPAPEGDAPFATHVGVSDSPWVEGTQIVHIGLQGMLPDERPPMNLVFLVDTSGSMNSADKLPLLKQSFRLMLGQLGENDTIAIVTYAGSAGLALEPTKATERETILAALDQMHAGGSTAGQAGLQQAYATAAQMA
uniref:vWA domain-containing protein n=1 Tax=uncultured Mameliella sp. TaxID=1447087 RepID=UPI00260F693B